MKILILGAMAIAVAVGWAAKRHRSAHLEVGASAGGGHFDEEDLTNQASAVAEDVPEDPASRRS